jgi:hypothetical protein
MSGLLKQTSLQGESFEALCTGLLVSDAAGPIHSMSVSKCEDSCALQRHAKHLLPS